MKSLVALLLTLCAFSVQAAYPAPSVRIQPEDYRRLFGVSERVARALYEMQLDEETVVCALRARKLDFTLERSLQLCRWTQAPEVYLCMAREYNAAYASNEEALQSCYQQYNRGELDSSGRNTVVVVKAAPQMPALVTSAPQEESSPSNPQLLPKDPGTGVVVDLPNF